MIKGEKHRTDAHVSTTPLEARHFEKSKRDKSRPRYCYMDQAQVEKRNYLVVDAETTKASDT